MFSQKVIDLSHETSVAPPKRVVMGLNCSAKAIVSYVSSIAVSDLVGQRALRMTGFHDDPELIGVSRPAAEAVTVHLDDIGRPVNDNIVVLPRFNG